MLWALPPGANARILLPLVVMQTPTNGGRHLVRRCTYIYMKRPFKIPMPFGLRYSKTLA